MAWEHRTVRISIGFGGILDEASVDRELNRVGERGWELVSVVAVAGGGGQTTELVAVFKRPAAARPE